MKTRNIAWMTGMLVILAGSFVQAQDSTRISPFHISLITPLGTNGLQSWNTVNRISVNAFAGFSGGLKGVEVAGFANALKGDMQGIQVAGFCNNTFGRADGLEVAGFWNFNRKAVKGLQVAGFTNVALDSLRGIQGSGFANLATGYMHGVQGSGFANVTTGPVTGIQGSGFANVATGDTKGLQAAGFANVTTGTLTGVQVSGFVNYARRLRGVQVAVVNVADTVESGLPIGIFCYVRNGYRAIQIGGNETLFGEISLKTGTTRFYNIFSVGAAVTAKELRWGWGYGIGTLVPLIRRMDLAVEGVAYHLNENDWFTGGLNLLNRLNLSACYYLTNLISVYAGASWNVKVTDVGTPEGWRISNMVSMYPGFTAGIRLAI